MPRAELNAEDIAALIAKHFGMHLEDMSYQWQVDDATGEFQGVVLFGVKP